MSNFKFSVGPWNVHEGADAFGPEVRKTISFDRNQQSLKKLGLMLFSFMMMMPFQI